jgi:hypothetical protein
MNVQDKQIEKMAKIIADCEVLLRGDIIWKDEDVSDDLALCIARVLNEEGYRKASEVAEDIIRILRAAGINEHRYPVIAAIKKKYTEGEG